MIFKPNPLKYWFTLIFAKPGQGKSLEQARISEQLIKEYWFIENKYKLPRRLLLTNQKLNLSEFRFWRGKPIPLEFSASRVLWWEKPEDFRYCPRKDCFKSKDRHDIHDCDILIDEGATLFPADKWSDTPFWLRKMVLQHRHNGLRFVVLTQNYAQIDVNFRRCVQKSYLMEKINFLSSRDISATLPPVKRIYGVYWKWEIDPLVLEQDQVQLLILLKDKDNPEQEKLADIKLIGRPSPHLITRHKIKLYDTTQNVKAYEPERQYEHIEGKCLDPNCGYTHVTHRLR